ncbi:3-alpha domain-containing protein [Streptomyces sp. INA 01156]
MAALLVAHHRPGFYLRVLEEGEVEAGQEIVKVSTGPEAMTVEEIDRVLYLPGHTRRQVERALRIPALSPGWQASMKALLDQGDDEAAATSGSAGLNAAATAPRPAWPGFRRWSSPASGPRAGACSPCRWPPPTVRICRRRCRGSSSRSRSRSRGRAAADPQLLTVRRAGHRNVPDQCEGRDPRRGRQPPAQPRIHRRPPRRRGAPRYLLPDRRDNPVVLLSAGVGVTPVLAMLHALARDHSSRQVWWLHGAHDGTEHPFARESRELVGALPRARSRI